MTFVRGRPSVCVIGAGNGGVAMAGHLGLAGLRVSLYSRCEEKVAPVREAGGVRLAGVVDGLGPVACATTDLSTALAGTDLVMVTTPASAHATVARQLAPHLADQIVVLNPGRTGGALEVAHVLRTAGRHNVVAEAQTFVYASRVEGPTRARIYEIKRTVPVAAFPAARTRETVWLLRRLYPQFVPATSVLETSLANIGAIFHPAPLILNAARVERGEEFDYYHEGITPAVAELMERVDQERLQVAAALGIRSPSAREWLRQAYGTRGVTLYQAIQNNRAYRGLTAPKTLAHRYISEDVPTGLVPLSSFAGLLNIPTPYTDSLIQMASGLHEVDYRAVGRTVQRLGLAGLHVVAIREYVMTGRQPAVHRRLAVWGRSGERGLQPKPLDA